MSADQYRELIARLEKAGEPAYALDCAISDFRNLHHGWSFGAPKAYTTSVDAALLLVPPHHLWQIKRGIECQAIVWMLETDYDERNPPTGYTTKFPALALCIAALKATAESGDGGRSRDAVMHIKAPLRHMPARIADARRLCLQLLRRLAHRDEALTSDQWIVK